MEDGEAADDERDCEREEQNRSHRHRGDARRREVPLPLGACAQAVPAADRARVKCVQGARRVSTGRRGDVAARREPVETTTHAHDIVAADADMETR